MIIMLLQAESSPKSEGFVITQFHHTEWSESGSPHTGGLIEMMDLITKSQISTGNRPIAIMCKYVASIT